MSRVILLPIILFLLSACAVPNWIFELSVHDLRYEAVELIDLKTRSDGDFANFDFETYNRMNPTTLQLRTYFSSGIDLKRFSGGLREYYVKVSVGNDQSVAGGVFPWPGIFPADGQQGRPTPPATSVIPTDLNRFYYYQYISVSLRTLVVTSDPINSPTDYDLITRPENISIRLVMPRMLNNPVESNIFMVPRDVIAHAVHQVGL